MHSKRACWARSAHCLSSVDLRKAWWTVGDQGNTGSCVGWASTEGIARYVLVTFKGLAQKTKLVTTLYLDGVQEDRRVSCAGRKR